MLENDNNKIEDIKRRLYDPNDTTPSHPKEGVLHPIVHNVPSSWHTDTKTEESSQNYNMKKPPMSPFKKFFIVAFVFFIGAAAYSTYTFIRGGSSISNDKIDITVLGSAFTKGGEELPLQIEINNRNNADLELADLVVEYPKGASDNAYDVVRLPRDIIGTIKKGSSITRNVKVTLFGDEKSIRNVKISLEYHPGNSNAIFTKEKDYPVTISTAPLSLVVDAPDTATSNQEISFKVTATLNTTLPDKSTMLQISYPNNFVFDSATPTPTLGNSLWNLSSLTQTNPVTINVKGRLIGQDKDEQVFHVYAGTTSITDQSVVNVVYNSLLKSIIITKPFLEAHILINNQDLPSYTARGGQTVNAQVTWVNNLPTRITDAQIIVNLSGNAFDKSTVNPLEGFYDSVNSQIVWDKNSVPDLASIEPGATGSVSFSFKSLSLIGLSNMIRDPQISLDVSIKGSQPSDGSTLNEVNNFDQKIIKILSDFQIAASAIFNSGSMPPKAETETKYTVTWTLANSANDVSQGQAVAVLPIYIKWIGPVTGTNENISYDDTTREVVWNIGDVRANTGGNLNREVSFILSITPSTSQVGSVPQLMKGITLTGQDTYADTLLKSTYPPITTQITNDPNYKNGDEVVTQ
ncbi:MAG: hypothetical protein KGI58_01220 [Patescibacteria group bacterium]|nr:hypothetical protein [Patescibacteria group bacterium]